VEPLVRGQEVEQHEHVGLPVKITNKVVQGNAAQVLLDESEGADLLVVGSRGHSGFVEALLGSTGQHCVQHADCPVVVIRDSITGPRRERREAEALGR